MAPPDVLFPVRELERRVHFHEVDLKDKSRKLGDDFNLKDCELYELVQYSCTTQEQHREAVLKDPTTKVSLECWPFVRLFRRCRTGDKVFHVETTAWEGQHAWRAGAKSRMGNHQSGKQPGGIQKENIFAEYGDYFWSKK